MSHVQLPGVMYGLQEGPIWSEEERATTVDPKVLRPNAFMFHAAIVGDITPCDGVSKEEKNRLETEAILEIKKMLGSDTWAGELLCQS